MTVLGRILEPERHRNRIARSPQGTLSGHNITVPALYEVKLETSALPIVVSNMRGSFVEGKRSEKTGIARYAFSEIPLEEEGGFLSALFQTLWNNSVKAGWKNRCKTVAEGIQRQRSFGLEPKFIVVSTASVSGSESDKEMLEKLAFVGGSVADMGDINVLVGDLPKGAALVTAAPALVGAYTRVGDHVGLMVYRANETVVLVADDVA